MRLLHGRCTSTTSLREKWCRERIRSPSPVPLKPWTKRIDSRYDKWNAPGEASENRNRSLNEKLLGVQINSDLGRRDIPPGYMPELIAMTIFIIMQLHIPRKWLQVDPGRWNRIQLVQLGLCCCFFRALAYCFSWPRLDLSVWASGWGVAERMCAGSTGLPRPADLHIWRSLVH